MLGINKNKKTGYDTGARNMSGKPRSFFAIRWRWKKMMVFIFFLFSIFFFSAKNSFALTYADTQRSTLKSYAGYSDSQIDKLQASGTSYISIITAIEELVSNKWGITDAANYVYNNQTTTSDAAGAYSENENVSISSALRGLAEGGLAVIFQAVVGVLSILVFFLKWLIIYAARTLDLALSPNLYNFSNSEMVVQGWTVVRDVCNLFFLLILLFIAICTILKIEKYHAKKTLLWVVLMALLINFSKPIAVFIFDGSQLLMNIFLSQMGTYGTGEESTSTIIAKSAKIAEIIYKSLPNGFTISETNTRAAYISIQYLFAVIFLFMLGVAYLVMAIFLIIRIVAIMILIIVSPLAFFAIIIPDFSKMSSKWWSALFEYSYYGPAAAFFLLLTTKLSSALPEVSPVKDGTNIEDTITNIVHYLTTIIFLYASIFMAKQFGGGAGATIVGNANKFMKWGAGMTKGGGMWGAAVRLPEKVPIAGNYYKGMKSGIAQRRGWRILNKEGRAEMAKDAQETGKSITAPFNIANVKKKAKERENDSEASIVSDALKGDSAAIMVASQMGYTKDANGNDIWTSPKLVKALANDDVRKSVYGNLRKKGKASSVIDAETVRQGATGNTEAITKLYNDELGGLSPSDFGKQDLGNLSRNATGRQWILSKLKNYENTDQRLITNILSGGHAKNIEFIRNLRNNGDLNNSQQGSAGQTGSIHTATDYRSRGRTVYDSNGRPVT
ncbi:MAG: hypothetical protein PHF35_01470 [Candidatus Moranbacteria bacterium]|nr:hypothetical protein [Candidatus Moranbacteria bacterium]